jgi:hypothetical protein
MDRDHFRYDEPSYGRPRRKKTNLFAWSVTILLLTGFAFAAWLGSFYIFWQPERAQSYRILKKLGKVQPIKRFELTAAPAGEFLTSKQIYDRFISLSPTELAKRNAELARNYIRNFQQVHGLVPYVIGRFNIMEARELTSYDLVTSGMVAITSAVDHGELLLEHIYPADPQALPLMKQTLVMGLEIKLERTHDLSAIIHAERLSDGRMLITTMPLLYGSYTVTRGPGTFTLEPPLELNLDAGWPLFKETTRRNAETQYAAYRDRVSPNRQNETAAGIAPTPSAPSANELIRVEPASPLEGPKVAVVTPPPSPVPPPATPSKSAKADKKKKGTPTPSPTSTRSPPVMVAQTSPTVAPSPVAPAKSPVAPPVAPTTPPAVAVVSPVQPAAASPSPTIAPDDSLASTAGGGNWKTFPPGKMPVGRLITLGDLRDLADRGLAGERVYLKGQFVVNFTEPNRAVLRPKTGITDAVLKLAGGGQNLRVIVDFPAGYTPPARGATVNRDEARPYEITEVRKQSDGQLNVFVREIMQ